MAEMYEPDWFGKEEMDTLAEVKPGNSLLMLKTVKESVAFTSFLPLLNTTVSCFHLLKVLLLKLNINPDLCVLNVIFTHEKIAECCFLL